MPTNHRPVTLAELEHAHDVGVVEPRREAGLVVEHPHELDIGGELGPDPLERDDPVEPALVALARREHLPHATGREGHDQLVTPDTTQRWGGRSVASLGEPAHPRRA